MTVTGFILIAAEVSPSSMYVHVCPVFVLQVLVGIYYSVAPLLGNSLWGKHDGRFFTENIICDMLIG